jgi:3-oxoacyl-[acyl-carrier-protein] synthase II
MKKSEFVISGMGAVTPFGVGEKIFWENLKAGHNAILPITGFATGKIPLKLAGEVKNLNPETYLGEKGLRNLDRSALFSLIAAKSAIESAKLTINDKNTDSIGVCTGTTFSHIAPIIEFDNEVFKSGLNFTNPALFPSTVVSAASSNVSIRFNIQGFNTTISTGYCSSLDALNYSVNAIESGNADTVLCGGVDTLSSSLFWGFNKLGYLAGIRGIPKCCPFDKRRNGPVLGEGAGYICLETSEQAKKRKARQYARVRSVASYFDASGPGKIHRSGKGLEKAIQKALDKAEVSPREVDYISSCADSSQDLDRMEIKALKNVFEAKLNKIPISSIKSMIGETFSAAGILQIISCVEAMHNGYVPPTINFREADPNCDIDCVANKSRKKDVRIALVLSHGYGGYNSACVVERI